MLHPDAEARYGISYDQELSEEEAQVVSLGVHAIFCRSLRGGGALPAMKLWIAKGERSGSQTQQEALARARGSDRRTV